jgi:hypothetical protein
LVTVNVGSPLLTVIATWTEVMQLDTLVAVSIYTVLVVGATTIDEVVAPVFHEKLLTALVVRLRESPEHIVVLPLTPFTRSEMLQSSLMITRPSPVTTGLDTKPV